MLDLRLCYPGNDSCPSDKYPRIDVDVSYWYRLCCGEKLLLSVIIGRIS
jgi:hypothetical protein